MKSLYEQIDTARQFSAKEGCIPTITEKQEAPRSERLVEQSTIGLGWAARQQPVQEEALIKNPLGAYPIAN